MELLWAIVAEVFQMGLLEEVEPSLEAMEVEAVHVLVQEEEEVDIAEAVPLVVETLGVQAEEEVPIQSQQVKAIHLASELEMVKF